MAVNAFDVMVNRVGTQPQFRGNLLFAVAGEQQLQCLALAGGKRFGAGRQQQNVRLINPTDFLMK